MKKISYWAKNNVKKARWIIALIQIFQVLSGIFIGICLFANDVFIHQGWAIALLTIVIGTVIIYPMQKNRNYYFQKACDLSLYYGICALIIIYSNQLPTQLGIDNFVETTEVTQDYEALLIVLKHKNETYSPPVHKEKRINKKLTRTEKKSLKQKIRAEIKKLRPQREGVALLVTLIVLLVLSIAVFGFAMAILACELSCAGTVSFITVLLSLFGVGGIVGCGIGIAKINRERRRLRDEVK